MRQPAATPATGPALLAAPPAAQLPAAAAGAGLTFTLPALPRLLASAGSIKAAGTAEGAGVGAQPVASRSIAVEERQPAAETGAGDVARRARGLAEEFFSLGDAAELQISLKVCMTACEP